MKFNRREFSKLGLMTGVGFGIPLGTVAGPAGRLVESASITSPQVKKFEVPLPVPPVLEPVRTEETTDYYEITQREETAEILPGYETTVWGYNGIFPGPTIEARRGQEVVVEQRNELPVPVSTHLHGGVTPPESDGFPTDLILPPDLSTDDLPGHISGTVAGVSRGSKEYRYPNEQRAATLWYHDHRMDFTGPQVYKGLAGFYIIRDDVEDELPLPEGEKEVPLMIADRTFTDDGEMYYPSVDPSLMGEHGVLASTSFGEHTGAFGDTILVNGAPWPRMEVSNTKYRFRILNASNARTYELALEPSPSEGSSFVQVGSDGGLLSEPIPHDKLLVSPAERFDVVIDFSHYSVGSEVTLVNRRGEGRVSDVMRFEVVREEEEESDIPSQLAPNLDFPSPEEAEVTRQFFFIAGMLGGMSTINGNAYDPERIDADPRLGSTEIWEFDADPAHPIHMHLVHFKVISRDGGPPGPYDAGWKDTVFLDGGTVRVVAKFTPYRGKYVFHCHNLEHEDMMMMANFEVI
ncbi:multicopper oxidase family protein [Natrinema salinisoli]|uniref:multicopper oxidase family protein n=1 Tax=Natrinema salinisoli TaxID=2878535 RepID=UPI001CF09ED8|nr:multicopper oxidase domain-containing protein [Natrinema salinisoli]